MTHKKALAFNHPTLLTIELVPKSSWYRNVRSNVSAEEWERLKKIVFAKANYRCEICGGRGARWPVECHEEFHYDDERHVQKLVRLIALCPACHEVKHLGLAGVRGREHVAMAHLMKVNGWSVMDKSGEMIKTMKYGYHHLKMSSLRQ